VCTACLYHHRAIILLLCPVFWYAEWKRERFFSIFLSFYLVGREMTRNDFVMTTAVKLF
jgi:hypothetical protein